MQTTRSIRNILISHIVYMIDNYQNFEFERDKSSLQHLLDDFTPWLDGTKNLSHYQNIEEGYEGQYQLYLSKGQKQKAYDFIFFKAALSREVGIYFGDTESIILELEGAYPDIRNTPLQLAEAEYRIKRLLCGYKKDTDFAGKSFYEFNIKLTEIEKSNLITKLNQEDKIYQDSKLSKGLLNIIKDKLTGPHKIARSVILDEVLEECEEIRQQDFAAQINSQDKKTALQIKSKDKNSKLPKKKPAAPKWVARARNSLSRIYAKKSKALSFQKNIGR
ncbi:MAG: hypothetical protein HON23_02695 [Rickettsiales bacterium]|jgi:hypothetical protein|nr:hypothetical protein [Rickettsiales bacterium]